MEVTKANLATYLAGLTPSATPYPIEITETVASDWGNSGTSGTVGSIIRASTPNGVFVDLGLTIIPSSVTDISSTFSSCYSLTTAPIIPSSVINIGYTFFGCTSLTTAPAIPSSVITMDNTFRDCTSLTTAPIIPSSVITMHRTFRGCTILTTAPIIPSSVINIGYTFFGCTSLTTAPAIPSSITSMSYTFYGCIKLHTIQNFAVDVDNCIMTDAFFNCPALANIYVATLSESSWHLLHTDTGATGTDYTIYNPDGTVAGSGTVAGTSQVLTLYGKSDELVISANITPTLAEETATSQVQWHKSGLPYDDELMIFNAKNPDTVISNFITVNRAGEEFLGNASTATKLATARKINGVDFDGTADVYDTYSTTETRIGTWIDGKPLYRKVVSMGALKWTGITSANHGISNVKVFTRITAIVSNADFSRFLTASFPKVSTTEGFNLQASKTAVYITTYGGFHTFTYSVAILEYTKTTD